MSSSVDESLKGKTSTTALRRFVTDTALLKIQQNTLKEGCITRDTNMELIMIQGT